MKRRLLCYILAFILGIFLSENILGIAIIAILFVLCEIACYLSKNKKLLGIFKGISYIEVGLFFLFMIIGWMFSYTFNFFRYEEVKLLNNKEIEVIGIVNSEGVDKKTYWQYIIKNNSINGKKIKSNMLLKTKEKLEYGNKIKVKAISKIPEGPRNENTFDYKKYLRTLNIYTTLDCINIDLIEDKDLLFIEKISFYIREKVREFSSVNLDTKNAGILNALIIGDESGIESELEDSYKKAGMLHLLVVSGGHTVFLIMLLKLFTTYTGISKRGSKILYIFVIFLYIFITGATASILRAGICIIIIIIAELIGRQNDSPTTLGLVALILLIINPNTLFSLSFLLSFGGVIGIMLCYSKISKWLVSIPKIIAEPLALTISAQLFVTPITIYSFNVIYFGGIISNIFTLSLSGIIMMGGIILFIVYLLIPPLVAFPMKIVDIFILLMNKIAEFFGSIEWLTCYTITPNVLSIIVYYGVLFYIFFEVRKEEINNNQLIIIRYPKIPIAIRRNFKLIFLLCGVISIIILNVKVIDFDKSLKIAMLDVGHGDSILITTPNDKYILIDTGDKYYQGGKEVDTGEKTIVPYLLKQGIKSIDLLILTHMDSDHIGGYESISKVIDIKTLGLSINSGKKEKYKEIKDIAKRESINIISLQSGDTFMFDGILVDVLYPYKTNEILEENNDSIVLLITYQNKKILFMGDLEKEGEADLLKLNKDIDADIIKIGHHGSSTSSTLEFIEKVSPKVALISVGNRFKSIPGKEVLDNISSVDSKVYRTDKNGEIDIVIENAFIDITTTY